MKIPKMILFDYGQTLIAEQKFDGVKGTEESSVPLYRSQSLSHPAARHPAVKGHTGLPSSTYNIFLSFISIRIPLQYAVSVLYFHRYRVSILHK